jgi:hypothetical protein
VNHTFSFSYPWWYIFFCLAAGGLYAFLMYYRDSRFVDYSPWFKRFLSFLRGLSVSTICFLLMSPFIKIVKEDIKQPIVVFAADNSSSMTYADKASFDVYKSKWGALAKSLESKYDIRTVTFGESVKENDQLDSLNGKSTNVAGLLEYIESNYADQNLGAIILGSDGIYNEGNNPLYTQSKFTAPLYTIALGDTTQKRDITVQNILSNKIAYLGDKFSIQVDVAAYNATGSKTNIVLESIVGGTTKKIAEEAIVVNGNSFFTSKNFIVNADQVGVVRYRVRVGAIPAEFNSANNKKEFFIEVLDARQKIILLANAPHPDLGALKSAITSNKNYDVEIVFSKDFNGNVSKYNLAILHNLPSDVSDGGSAISNLKKNSIPMIFMVGTQTSLPKLNLVQDVIGASGNSKNREEITPELNAGFNLFTTSDELKRDLNTFPPLIAPFGEYRTLGTSNTYLYQKIKKIKTTYPLVSFGEKDNVKTAVWIGEGFWKWRLFDHLQHKNYDATTELINKTIQLASVKSDKRKFRANTSKSLYKDSEPVLFDAQLYNDSYELVSDPDVKLVIKDENNKEFTYQFSKNQNYYLLDAGSFSTGVYSYVASTSYNGKALTASGRFNVESIELEQFDLTARHGLLKGLCEKYNGHMFYPANMQTIADSILANQYVKPMLFQTNSTKPIIHLKWLFFLLLLTLVGEWFLRRYFGSY